MILKEISRQWTFNDLHFQYCDSYCRSLSECSALLLEVLVTLVGDDYGNISTFCQRALNDFQQSVVFNDGPASETVLEVLEENLYRLVTQLPRLIRTAG